MNSIGIWLENNNGAQPSTHPADGEGDAGLARAHTHEAESQLPVEQMLRDERDKGQRHGGSQHVEYTCHVVYIQLTAHHLVFLIVADASQPQGFQFLHLTCKQETREGKLGGRNVHRESK